MNTSFKNINLIVHDIKDKEVFSIYHIFTCLRPETARQWLNDNVDVQQEQCLTVTSDHAQVWGQSVSGPARGIMSQLSASSL